MSLVEMIWDNFSPTMSSGPPLLEALFWVPSIDSHEAMIINHLTFLRFKLRPWNHSYKKVMGNQNFVIMFPLAKEKGDWPAASLCNFLPLTPSTSYTGFVKPLTIQQSSSIINHLFSRLVRLSFFLERLLLSMWTRIKHVEICLLVYRSRLHSQK